MKIAFTDFWGPCFNPHNNFFTNFLKKYREDIMVVEPGEADVIFFTSKKYMGTENHKKYNCKKVYYQMENDEYPNLEECDVCLTFNYEDLGGKNVRLPYWITCVNWFDLKEGYCTREDPHHCGLCDPRSLISPENVDCNLYSQRDKTEFCCIVVNHLRNRRDEVLAEIKKYRHVDCYGKIFNNRLSTFGNNFYDTRDDKKLELISKYKFNICFEANMRPGYVCEKILHAKAAGCIPLANIDKTVSTDFNPKCFLNLQDFDTVEEYVNKIIQMDKDDTIYKSMRSQPLFHYSVSLDPIYQQFKHVLKM